MRNMNFSTRNSDGVPLFYDHYSKYLTVLALASISLYLLINWLPTVFTWLLPFSLSFGLVQSIRPIVDFLYKNWNIPNRAASIVILLIVLSLFLSFIWWLFSHLISELILFSQNIGLYISMCENYVKNIESLSPHFSGLTSNINAILTNFSLQLVSYVAGFAVELPDKMIFVFVFLLSSFFLAWDYNFIFSSIKSRISPSKKRRIIMIKGYAITAVFKYIRGMLIIMCIDYAVLLCGLIILNVDYAFLIALVLSFLDILPLIGTGIVLIPWGVSMLIFGDISGGVGIIALYAAVTLIRQLTEPKIMSSSLGIYPLVTLISVYIGYKALGFMGVCLFPIAILIIIYLYRAGAINFWHTGQ